METVCLQCGMTGFTNAFVYCVRCLNFAVHRYCLDILPKTVDEFVCWNCDDCSLENKMKTVGNKPQLMKNNTAAVKKKECNFDGAYREQSHISCTKFEYVECAELSERCCLEEYKVSDEKKRWMTSSSRCHEKEKTKDNLMQQNSFLRGNSGEKSQRKRKRRLIRLSDKLKEGKNLDRLSSNEESAIDSDLLLSPKKRYDQNFSCKPCESDRKPGASASSTLSSNGCSLRISQEKMAISCESQMVDPRQGITFSRHVVKNKRLILEKQCSDVSTVEGSVDQSDNLSEIRKSGTTEGKAPAHEDLSTLPVELPEDLNIASSVETCEPGEPVLDSIWRGSFSIWNKEEPIHGLMAHMSSRACERAYKEAHQFPSLVELEILPKSDIWPKSFETVEPSGHIALYFFPSNISSEKDYDILVDEMLNEELAMRAIVQNAELLVFTSTELQLPYWRFRGKYYLWGVFREKQQ